MVIVQGVSPNSGFMTVAASSKIRTGASLGPGNLALHCAFESEQLLGAVATELHVERDVLADGKPDVAAGAESDLNQNPAKCVPSHTGAEAKRYRDRAKDCRDIAKASTSGEWQQALLEMADAFEEEADRLDAEEKSASGT